MALNIPSLLDLLVSKLQEAPAELNDIDAVFQLDIENGSVQSYQLTVSENKAVWYHGRPFPATCTVSINEKDLDKLLAGSLNPSTAVLTGRIKIKGDRSQLLKLQAALSRHFTDLPLILPL